MLLTFESLNPSLGVPYPCSALLLTAIKFAMWQFDIPESHPYRRVDTTCDAHYTDKYFSLIRAYKGMIVPKLPDHYSAKFDQGMHFVY